MIRSETSAAVPTSICSIFRVYTSNAVARPRTEYACHVHRVIFIVEGAFVGCLHGVVAPCEVGARVHQSLAVVPVIKGHCDGGAFRVLDDSPCNGVDIRALAHPPVEDKEEADAIRREGLWRWEFTLAIDGEGDARNDDGVQRDWRLGHD